MMNYAKNIVIQLQQMAVHQILLVKRLKNGVFQDVREFNTQACEQLNSWLGGFESILKWMTSKNFDWFLHVMLFYHAQHVLAKKSVPPIADNQDDSVDDSVDDSEDEESGSSSDQESSSSEEESINGLSSDESSDDNDTEDTEDTTTNSDDVSIGNTNSEMVEEDDDNDEDEDEMEVD